jgi:protein-S-isoprenylcysteine O-methyltransferase Ste14
MRVHAASSARFARLFSATGALLFIASLGYFAAVYLTSFGVPPVDAVDTATVVTFDVTLFTLFAFHHSLFARGPIRRWVAETVAPELERSVYVWVASVLFIAVCAWWRPIEGVAWRAPDDSVALWVLRGLQAGGVVLTLGSAIVLDFRELSGLRVRTSEPPTEFSTSGPYGWVRHPIYVGWFLFVWAASPMTMTRLIFALTSCLYLLIAIPLEERTIRTTSGGAYERYMTKVRWRLIPGVY